MKTSHYSIIAVLGMLLGNHIGLVNAELSNPLAPPSNEECYKKITDAENNQASSYDENKAINLATNSPELKNRPVGYQYVFDSAYKHFDVDTHSCNAVWRYVNVVFDLKDPQGNILSQITITEDAQLTRVIAASLQQHTPPTTQMTSPNVAYMIPQRELDSRIALVMLFSMMAVTVFLIIHFSRKSKSLIPKGIAAARIFFSIFSMMLLSVMVFLPFNMIHNDSSDEQIFSVIGSVFYIVDYPTTYTTNFILEHSGMTDKSLENMIGSGIIIIFGIASTVATYGFWTRRNWSWKSCVGIMLFQLGLCVFSLQLGVGMIIPLLIPALVILDLLRADVRNYFHSKVT